MERGIRRIGKVRSNSEAPTACFCNRPLRHGPNLSGYYEIVIGRLGIQSMLLILRQNTLNAKKCEERNLEGITDFDLEACGYEYKSCSTLFITLSQRVIKRRPNGQRLWKFRNSNTTLRFDIHLLVRTTRRMDTTAETQELSPVMTAEVQAQAEETFKLLHNKKLGEVFLLPLCLPSIIFYPQDAFLHLVNPYRVCCRASYQSMTSDPSFERWAVTPRWHS